MAYKFIIYGKLPGINELIECNRSNIHKGSSLKSKAQHICECSIRQCLGRLKLDKPVVLKYYFYEQNKRRDLDNISGFAHKVIQDALVKCGVLQNDGWKNIIGYEDHFFVDKLHPRIEVIIETEV